MLGQRAHIVQPRKQLVSHVHSVPAPTRGWNARDAIANMPEGYAIILDNYIPTTADIRIRPGRSAWATTLGGQVQTLTAYLGPVTKKLIAAANGNIWDVTAAGAGTSIASGKTSNKWQTAMFGTAAGNFLYFVNGADAPIYYDGAAFTTAAITGVTVENLIHVNVYKQRLFFVEKNTLNFYFPAAATIAGAVTKFDIGPFCRRGGYLVATATWTFDGGFGPDDYLVCLTSEGEAVVFTGTNPAVAADWLLKGVYRTGKPIDRRCFVKVGGDLVVITEDGYHPFSTMLRNTGKVGAISDIIRDAVTAAVRSYSANFGWQPLLIPHLNLLLFNVPTDTGGTTSEQHVMNTITGAWCRFRDIPATCWYEFNGVLYFGGNATVKTLDVDETSDESTNINTDVMTAYSYLKRQGLKQCKMVRPVFVTDSTLIPAIELNYDYDSVEPSTVASAAGTGSPLWDVSPWNTTAWGGTIRVQKDWLGANGIGYAVSARMKGATKNIGYALQAIDYMFEQGGYL